MYSNDPNKYHIISAMLIGVQPSQSMDIVIGCHRENPSADLQQECGESPGCSQNSGIQPKRWLILTNKK